MFQIQLRYFESLANPEKANMIEKLLFFLTASCSLVFDQTAQSACINGKIFRAVSTALNFDAAKSECEVLDEGQGTVFSLAQLRTIDKFQAVLPLISAALGPDDFKAFWIGNIKLVTTSEK